MPICTCSRCIEHTVLIDGVVQPGREVSYAARRDHQLLEDAAAQSKHLEQPTHSRNVIPPGSRSRPINSSAQSQHSYSHRHTEPKGHLIFHSIGTQIYWWIIVIHLASEAIVQLICTVVIWLHLHGGVSRTICNILLKAIQHLLDTLFRQIEVALNASEIHVSITRISLPQDIRTAYKSHSVEPNIVRTASCPTCFSLYPDAPIPEYCDWKESPRSRPCHTKLWRTIVTKQGPRMVPKQRYNTQSFTAFLSFFLSRQFIEDDLLNNFAARKEPVIGQDMRDLHDSPAWRQLNALSTSAYDLIFGIYIDWLNPYSNKTAGKVVSCGAITLYCLSLSEYLRYRRENTLVIGITPPPHAPTMVTISHVLSPVVDMLREHAHPHGQTITTHYHPEGITSHTTAAPLIADAEAAHKCNGNLSHSATFFCPYCMCVDTELSDLNKIWEKRNGATVRQQAEAWLHLTTKSGRQQQASATGIRWTPLHQLPYWDPVNHLVLGFMHNWLEGVLQHQLRDVWGVGRSSTTEDMHQRNAAEIAEFEQFNRDDVESSASELSDLEAEAREADLRGWSYGSTFYPPSSPSPSLASSHSTNSSSGTIMPLLSASHFDENDNNETDSDDDHDFIPDNSPFEFTEAQLSHIRGCIAAVTLPTWVQRPPSNLGEKTHGRLKAQEYLILFTVIFPLGLPEIWISSDTTERDHQNFIMFCHLVSATNILAAFKTSDHAANTYTFHYKHYRFLLQTLYPDISEKPNHHYAMHNGDMLKYWGPLAAITEFPGERTNGDLQKINTNRRLYDMDLTMLRQISRRARLDALLSDPSPDGSVLGDILHPSDATENTGRLTATDEAAFLQSASELNDDEYTRLLAFLGGLGHDLRHHNNFPHPSHATVLPPYAIKGSSFRRKNETFSTQLSHKGNSAIQFRHSVTMQEDTGFIQEIWSIPLHGIIRRFCLVRAHHLLTAAEESCAPFQSHPGLMTRIVDASPVGDIFFIEDSHIITHVTTLPRPTGTYGIDKETLVVCWALNRRRH